MPSLLLDPAAPIVTARSSEGAFYKRLPDSIPSRPSLPRYVRRVSPVASPAVSLPPTRRSFPCKLPSLLPRARPLPPSLVFLYLPTLARRAPDPSFRPLSPPSPSSLLRSLPPLPPPPSLSRSLPPLPPPPSRASSPSLTSPSRSVSPLPPDPGPLALFPQHASASARRPRNPPIQSTTLCPRPPIATFSLPLSSPSRVPLSPSPPPHDRTVSRSLIPSALSALSRSPCIVFRSAPPSIWCCRLAVIVESCKLTKLPLRESYSGLPSPVLPSPGREAVQ